MVFSCEYPGCFNIAKVLRLRAPTSTGDGRLTFHKFPVNDPERLRLWLLAIRWDVNTPVERVYKRMLCSEHFRSEDYKEGKSGSSRRLLKSSAVPVPALWFQPKEGTTRHPVPAQSSLYGPATGEDEEEETDVQGASAFFEGVPRSTLIKQSNVEQSEGIVTRLIWTLTSPEALASKTRSSTSGTCIAFPPVHSYQSDKPTQTQPKTEENDVEISTLSLDLCPPCLRDSFVPTSSTSTSTPTPEEEREDGMWKERRWIVNESNLMGLFKRCQDCGALITETKKISSGGLVLVQWECEKGHLGQWNSSL